MWVVVARAPAHLLLHCLLIYVELSVAARLTLSWPEIAVHRPLEPVLGAAVGAAIDVGCHRLTGYAMPGVRSSISC